MSETQALWDREDATLYRERVRAASAKVIEADAQLNRCRTSWLAARKALATTEAAVTAWIMATAPIAADAFLQRLQALEVETQLAEEEVRRSKGELNAARAKRVRAWNERRVCIRAKFELYPLEEFAQRQQETNDRAAEVQVLTARVPAEQLAELLEKRGESFVHTVSVRQDVLFDLRVERDKVTGFALLGQFGNWHLPPEDVEEYWPYVSEIVEAAELAAGLSLRFKGKTCVGREIVLEFERSYDYQQPKKPRRRRKEQA